jgi:hypothetical protein
MGGIGAPGGAEGVGTGINPNASIGIDPNAALTQSTNVGTQALNLNPSTGAAIDPLSNIKPPVGGAGFSPNYSLNAPTQATQFGALRPPPAPASVTPGAAANKGFFDGMSTGTKVAGTLGGAALLSSLTDQDIPVTEEEKSKLRRISPDFRAQGPVQPNPYYRPVYAAGGGGIGDIMMAQGGAYDDEPMGDVGGMARGGIASLGGYSDGGRMLKGPGDGMSDSIPAMIGKKQPARLADGEFVVPADVVSHLGNGSTDAGAKKLYAMMDRVRQARTGKKKQAPAVKTQKYMPA